MSTLQVEEFLIAQNADRDAWYVDMRGAAISFGDAQGLEELIDTLAHCREYLEEKKKEWVHAILFQGTGAESSITFTTYGDMQLVRAQLERCKSLIIGKRGKPSTHGLDGERPRFTVSRLEEEVRQAETINAVGAELLEALHAMRWTTRSSYIGINEVLILKNPSGIALEFTLRCIATNDFSKDLYVSISASSRTEIGNDEGWDRNWVSGERFEVWSNERRVWGATIS